MNVFATLKTVFFGSKFLSAPVPSDGTPRRDFVSTLNGLMPLCRTIPGVHLAVDIREGRVALVLNWTPRTDGNALAGTYHYIVSDEDGVKEVDKSQVLPAENGKGNLSESRNEAPGCPAVLIEKTEKEAAQSGGARKVMNIAHSKDIEKEAGLEFSEDVEKKIGVISSEGNRKEAGLESSKEEVKKAKSCSLMQEVTAFLTSASVSASPLPLQRADRGNRGGKHSKQHPRYPPALHQSGRTMDELAQHGSHRNRHRLLGQRHPTLCALAPHQRIPSLYRLF